MRKNYSSLLAQYPETITLDQLYKICHFSKRKGRWLLENNIIPCMDTGKKTHRFQIQLADVIVFLKKRDSQSIEETIPDGIFSNRKPYQKAAPPHIDEMGFEAYLQKEWVDVPDALTSMEAAALLGYHRVAINAWVLQKKLPAIDYYGRIIIAKEHWIQFLSRTVNQDIVDKSPTHLKLIEQYQQEKENKDL